jgi:hypothetical protein
VPTGAGVGAGLLRRRVASFRSELWSATLERVSTIELTSELRQGTSVYVTLPSASLHLKTWPCAAGARRARLVAKPKAIALSRLIALSVAACGIPESRPFVAKGAGGVDSGFGIADSAEAPVRAAGAYIPVRGMRAIPPATRCAPIKRNRERRLLTPDHARTTFRVETMCRSKGTLTPCGDAWSVVERWMVFDVTNTSAMNGA